MTGEIEGEADLGRRASNEVAQYVGRDDFEHFVDGDDVAFAGAHIAHAFKTNPFVHEWEGGAETENFGDDFLASIVGAAFATVVFAERFDIHAQGSPARGPIDAPGQFPVTDDGDGFFKGAGSTTIGDSLARFVPCEKRGGDEASALRALGHEGAPVGLDFFAGEAVEDFGDRIAGAQGLEDLCEECTGAIEVASADAFGLDFEAQEGGEEGLEEKFGIGAIAFGGRDLAQRSADVFGVFGGVEERVDFAEGIIIVGDEDEASGDAAFAEDAADDVGGEDFAEVADVDTAGGADAAGDKEGAGTALSDELIDRTIGPVGGGLLNHALLERHGVAEAGFCCSDTPAIETDELRVAGEKLDQVELFLTSEDTNMALVRFGIARFGGVGIVSIASTGCHTNSLLVVSAVDK